MHRRVAVVSLTSALALMASPVTAQLFKSNVTPDSNVRPASCHSSIGGCAGCDSCGGNVTVLPGIGGCGGDCSGGHLGNFGACGPGGCASGDCTSKCFAAPFGHCLYPNPCYGPCCEIGCKTIFGELALDIRRWCLGRKSCGRGPLGGSLLSPGIGGFTDGMRGGLPGGSLLDLGSKSCSDGEAMEISCGCETAGCSGDCSMGTGVEVPWDGRPGGLLGRMMERSCGCENAGCLGGCSSDTFAAAGELESSCGCETVGGAGDACFQDVLSPCRGRGLLGAMGGLLFGESCGCNSCSGSCSNDECSGMETSCGVEDAGIDCKPFGDSRCAAAIRQPQAKLVSAEEPLRSKLLAKRIILKPNRSQVVAITQQRSIRFATDPQESSETESAIERVRYHQESNQKQTIRFLGDQN